MREEFFSMSEIVEYDFPNTFNAQEEKFFWWILNKAVESNRVVVKTQEVRDFADLGNISDLRTITILSEFLDKLIEIKIAIFKNGYLEKERISLLESYKTRIKTGSKKDEVSVELQMNDLAIKSLGADFLADLKSGGIPTTVRHQFKNRYARRLYRFLLPHIFEGRLFFTKEELFDLLVIPESYDRNKGKLTKSVFVPIKQELSPIFKGLRLSKKYKAERGAPLYGYKFTWNVSKINSNNSFKMPSEEFLDKI